MEGDDKEYKEDKEHMEDKEDEDVGDKDVEDDVAEGMVDEEVEGMVEEMRAHTDKHHRVRRVWLRSSSSYSLFFINHLFIIKFLKILHNK